MSRIGLFTDRGIFAAGLRQALLPEHRLEVMAVEDWEPAGLASLAASQSELGGPRATGLQDTALDFEALILDAPPERSPLLIRYLRGGIPLVVWERVTGSEPALSALGCGVQGVLLDGTSATDALLCLNTVLHGGMWVPASIAQAVLSTRCCPLTRREGQLVDLVSQGLSNKEIATALGISVGTVKVYFSRLFDKLGVSDRYALAMLGLRQAGTVSPVPGHNARIGGIDSRPGQGLRSVFLPQAAFPPRVIPHGVISSGVSSMVARGERMQFLRR